MTTDISGRSTARRQDARILLVDDMEDNLVALEAVLSALQVPLVRAESGEEAMKALLRQEFAVVLLDVLMPGMDGFETAAHMKRLDQTKDIPIIFLTGARTATDAGYAFRGYSTGAVDYLTKPFDPWVLRTKVAVFLDLHRKNQQLQELLDEEQHRLEDFAQRLTAVEEQLSREVAGAAGAAGAAPGQHDFAALAESVAKLTDALHELRLDRR